MRRVLIVDDEPIIVRGLLSVLEDSGLDIDLYKAYSSEEALAILSDTRMDIVVSDVRMPGMDGLQLMEHINRDWPECRVIFLSGHSEFDSIYRAVRGAAVTFLLKTEGFDKIVSTLRETIDRMDQAQRNQETRNQLLAQQAVTRQLFQRDALTALIQGTSRKAYADGLEISLQNPVLPLYAYIESGTADLSLEEFHKKLLSADRTLRVHLSPYPIRIAFWNHEDDLLWLLQPDDSLPMTRCVPYVRENLDLIQADIQAETGLTLAFALHSSPVPAEQLSDAYLALRRRICRGVGLPGMIALQPSRGRDEAPPLPDSVLARLQDALEHLNRKEFMGAFSEATRALRQRSRMDDPFALEIFLSLSRLFLAHINRRRLHDSVQFPGGLTGLTSAAGFTSWNQAADAFTELAEAIFRSSDADQGSRSQAIVTRIKDYIGSHLNRPDELSLTSIAANAYFNPAYLSRLFHQVTGETLSEYISAERIRKANELLRNSGTRISDISEAVGFSSSANFTRFYRKMAGCTPQEYRDRLARSAFKTNP
ncbi:MAG: response regulator [Clostridia bacterium]|nr:response regulator [Clostridia bacterium]